VATTASSDLARRRSGLLSLINFVTGQVGEGDGWSDGPGGVGGHEGGRHDGAHEQERGAQNPLRLRPPRHRQELRQHDHHREGNLYPSDSGLDRRCASDAEGSDAEASLPAGHLLPTIQPTVELCPCAAGGAKVIF
jgi:hypothetical protein